MFRKVALLLFLLVYTNSTVPIAVAMTSLWHVDYTRIEILHGSRVIQFINGDRQTCLKKQNKKKTICYKQQVGLIPSTTPLPPLARWMHCIFSADILCSGLSAMIAHNVCSLILGTGGILDQAACC